MSGYYILAHATVDPSRWPYAGRVLIEDNGDAPPAGDYIHLHVNNWRLEFSRDQFRDFALVVNSAADALRKVMARGSRV